MASAVALSERRLARNFLLPHRSNSVKVQQHFPTKEIQMDGNAVRNWTHLERSMMLFNATKPEIGRNERSYSIQSLRRPSPENNIKTIPRNARSFNSFLNDLSIRNDNNPVIYDQKPSLSRESVQNVSNFKTAVEIHDNKSKTRSFFMKNQSKPDHEEMESVYSEGFKSRRTRETREEASLSKRETLKLSFDRKPNKKSAPTIQQNNGQLNRIKTEENSQEVHRETEPMRENIFPVDDSNASLDHVDRKMRINDNAETAIKGDKEMKGKTDKAISEEVKIEPKVRRVLRVISFKDKDFLRFKRGKYLNEEAKGENSSASSAMNSVNGVATKLQIEPIGRTPEDFLPRSYRSSNKDVQTIITQGNRVRVEVKLRIQPDISAPADIAIGGPDFGEKDNETQATNRQNVVGHLFEFIEEKRRLADFISQTHAATRETRDDEIICNINQIEKCKGSKGYTKLSEMDFVSPELDSEIRGISAEARSSNIRMEVDDSAQVAKFCNYPQVAETQSPPDCKDVRMSSAEHSANENSQNNTEIRAAQSSEKRKIEEPLAEKLESTRRRKRAITISGPNQDLDEIFRNYHKSEESNTAKEAEEDFTKSEERLGRIDKLCECRVSSLKEPVDVGVSEGINIEKSADYRFRPRLWRLPLLRSFSSNKMIFTDDRNLLKQLSDEVRDILITDARQRRISADGTTVKTVGEEERSHGGDRQDESDSVDQFSSDEVLKFGDLQQENVKNERKLNTIGQRLGNNGATVTDISPLINNELGNEAGGSGSVTSKFPSNSENSEGDSLELTTTNIASATTISENQVSNGKEGSSPNENPFKIKPDDKLIEALEKIMIIAASEEYMKQIDIMERNDCETVRRRQRNDRKQFLPRRSLHENFLSDNEKLHFRRTKSSDSSADNESDNADDKRIRTNYEEIK